MSNCIFLGEEKAFLIVGEEEEALEKDMREWTEEFKKFMNERSETYTTAYRSVLDIPFDATSEEEKEMVLERFGEDPMNNQEFTDLLESAREVYEASKPDSPDWQEWFENRGFMTIDVTHIIDVRD